MCFRRSVGTRMTKARIKSLFYGLSSVEDRFLLVVFHRHTAFFKVEHLLFYGIYSIFFRPFYRDAL